VRFALWQNQPNPFAATTTIRFDLPVGEVARLEVFDTQGRRVRTLANHFFPAGRHSVEWSPASSGSLARPGIYFCRIEAGPSPRPGFCFCRIEAGPFRDRKRMILLP